MSEKECLCTTPEYTIELNQQGPPGIQGEPGADGFSPSITVAQQDPNTYILTILTKDGQLNTPNLQGRGVPGDGTSGYWLTSKGGYETAWQALPEAEIGVRGIIAIAGEEELVGKSTDTAVTPAQLISRTPQANANTFGMVRPNNPLYIDPDNDGELYISEAGPGQQGTVQYGSRQADVSNMTFLGLDDNRPSEGEAKLNGVWLPVADTTILGGVKPDGTTITVDTDGTIHGAQTYTLPIASEAVLGGIKVGTNLTITDEGVLSAQVEGGTTNYNELTNKPSINNIELEGNLTSEELGLAETQEVEELGNELNSLSSTVTGLTTSKQDVLTAGDNITITNNTISAIIPEVGQATSTTLGAVKANAKQDTDTQEVRIDSTTGLLYTAPGLPDVIDGGNAGSYDAVTLYGVNQQASFGVSGLSDSLNNIQDSWEEITE